MSAPATEQRATIASLCTPGWMRSPAFDLSFIHGVAILALATGLVGIMEPRLFAWVLVLDIWLLGYHHVVSTFTRLIFDKQSFQEYRYLVIHVPILVLVGTAVAVMALGIWVLPTVYLYWQWFHYTRQSYGIERIYRRKADKQASVHDYLATRALYLLPLLGILYRSYQQQPFFLGMQIKYLPMTLPVLWIVGALTAVAMFAWTIQQLTAFWQGRLALAHFMYLLTHHVIFLAGYLLIEDITTGWLVLNVWHNAQYILLVWSFNNNRFKKGIDPKHAFLSTISQSKNMLAYFGVCLAISTVAYAFLGKATGELTAATAIPVTLTVFMVINFHHYVVDSIIWKVRRPALQKNLGITS